MCTNDVRCNDCSSRGDPKYCDICNVLYVVYDNDNNNNKENDDEQNNSN